MFTVYKHTNLINNKSYIGITNQKPEARWGTDGVNYKYKTIAHFYSAIKKYGWQNFSHEILFQQLTKEEACKKEQELIEQYRTMDPAFGYNSTSGGDYFVMSDASRHKLSNSMKGNTNGLGHPCSKEKALKISNTQKGRRLTEEHRRKISQAKKGESHRPLSEKERKTISNSSYHQSRKKAVICLDTNVIYESVQECARELHLDATNVSAVCLGKHSHTKGYHFKLINNR